MAEEDAKRALRAQRAQVSFTLPDKAEIDAKRQEQENVQWLEINTWKGQWFHMDRYNYVSLRDDPGMSDKARRQHLAYLRESAIKHMPHLVQQQRTNNSNRGAQRAPQKLKLDY